MFSRRYDIEVVDLVLSLRENRHDHIGVTLPWAGDFAGFVKPLDQWRHEPVCRDLGSESGTELCDVVRYACDFARSGVEPEYATGLFLQKDIAQYPEEERCPCIRDEPCP